MISIQFKAISLVKELNLNLIANHFEITKRFDWEDFLTLNEPQLAGVLNVTAEKRVILFPFGCGVFLNMATHEIHDVVKYLQAIEPELGQATYEFSDDYHLEIDPNLIERSVNNDFMVVETAEDFHVSIPAVILAKSVALERIEMSMGQLLDEVETVMLRLEAGKLGARDQKIAKISAKILSYKFNTISYLMLLDKPDLTWNNEQAGSLYDDLAHIFELSERYQTLEAKADSLMDIVDVFISFTQHKKANFLEIMIILLIMIEIVFTVIDFFSINLATFGF